MKSGRTDYIFSAPEVTAMSYQGMKVKARYAVISDQKVIIKQ